jgi:hypothetical protein
MEILDKIELFTETIAANKYPDNPSKYEGMRPIQFMTWWGDFRPGDRVDVMFGEDYISFAGTNAEGHFAGIKKEADIEGDEVDMFKSAEGRVWNFV